MDRRVPIQRVAGVRMPEPTRTGCSRDACPQRGRIRLRNIGDSCRPARLQRPIAPSTDWLHLATVEGRIASPRGSAVGRNRTGAFQAVGSRRDVGAPCTAATACQLTYAQRFSQPAFSHSGARYQAAAFASGAATDRPHLKAQPAAAMVPAEGLRRLKRLLCRPYGRIVGKLGGVAMRIGGGGGKVVEPGRHAGHGRDEARVPTGVRGHADRPEILLTFPVMSGVPDLAGEKVDGEC